MIKYWASTYLEKLINELSKTIIENKLPGNLRSGAWVERETTVFGYISYSPHQNPNEEFLEFSIIAKVFENYVSITMDIGWSDGEIIKEVSQDQIPYQSNEELISIIESLGEAKFAQILSEIISIVKVDRPPKFRSN
jgi:hypothetical protein